MTPILAGNMSFFNPCYNGNVDTYATVEKLKMKVFTLKSYNMKVAIGIQFTFN